MRSFFFAVSALTFAAPALGRPATEEPEPEPRLEVPRVPAGERKRERVEGGRLRRAPAAPVAGPRAPVAAPVPRQPRATPTPRKPATAPIPRRPTGPVTGTPPRAGTPAGTRPPAGPRTGVGVPVGPSPRGGAAANPPPRPMAPGARPAMALPALTPAHGVFLYGPLLGTHDAYPTDGPVDVAKRDLPTRAVDRAGSLAVGLRGGVFGSSTPEGSAVYADPGAGLTVRYRPLEFLGIEAAGAHYLGGTGLDAGEPVRTSTPLSGSLQVFAFPWSRVSPFGTVGATANLAGASLVGTPDAQPEATLWGPHAGLGLELAIGQSLAFDLDGRFNYLVNAAAQGASPANLTAGLGMLFHF